MTRREEIENQIEELQKELVKINKSENNTKHEELETLFCILVRAFFPDIYIFYGWTIDVVFGKWDINRKIIRYIPGQEKMLMWDDKGKPIYLNQDTLVELLKELKITYGNDYCKEDLKGY